MLNYVLQIVVNGLTMSAIYILIALGFTLIFGIMRVVNFAHGEFYMLGGVAVYVLAEQLGWNYGLSVVAASLGVGLLGLLVEQLIMKHAMGREINGMIVALGVSTCLRALVVIIMGPQELAVSRPVTGAWISGGLSIPYDKALITLVVIFLLAAFYSFLAFTSLGLSMRAVAQDPLMASLYGVRPRIVNACAFGIGCLLAGIAGALVAPIYTVNPGMGEGPMMKAFVIVVLGGLGSIPGAVLGGLLLGLFESFFATVFNSTIAAIIVFSALVIFLSVRPNGLLGKAES